MRRTVIIDGADSWDDFGLALTTAKIGLPEPKRQTVDIPGADGALDFTDFFGGAKFHNRLLEFVFSHGRAGASWSDMADRQAEIAGRFHGRRVEIALSWQPDYYFTGRVTAEVARSRSDSFELRLEADCDPYRIATVETALPFSWPGQTDYQAVTIDHEGRTITPTLVVTGEIGIRRDDVELTLPAGTYRHRTLRLVEGVNSFEMRSRASGGATASIQWREERL